MLGGGDGGGKFGQFPKENVFFIVLHCVRKILLFEILKSLYIGAVQTMNVSPTVLTWKMLLLMIMPKTNDIYDVGGDADDADADGDDDDDGDHADGNVGQDNDDHELAPCFLSSR